MTEEGSALGLRCPSLILTKGIVVVSFLPGSKFLQDYTCSTQSPLLLVESKKLSEAFPFGNTEASGTTERIQRCQCTAGSVVLVSQGASPEKTSELLLCWTTRLGTCLGTCIFMPHPVMVQDR